MSIYENSKRDAGYHLGHVFMDKMSRKAPDDICTIDAATGKKETYGSVLSRSVALAVSLRRAGLKPGDVLLLGGTLHLEIRIPHYSALLNGLPILGVDPYSKYDELKPVFEKTTPKIAFCQQETVDLYKRVAQDVGIDVKIVTFDGGECTLSKFLETYGGDEPTDEFKPADFDTEKIYAWLILTSGSTGEPKVAAFKHKVLIEKMFYFETNQLHEDWLMCDFSSVQGSITFLKTVYPPLVTQCTTLISNYYYSDNIAGLIDVINKYRVRIRSAKERWGKIVNGPTYLVTTPPRISLILRHEKHCDMTCFDKLIVSGCKVSEQLITELKSRTLPDATVIESYGMAETIGLVFVFDPSAPIGSCGSSTANWTVKLVDPETGVEITQPHVTGELLYKGPCFTEYYNSPEQTAKAFTEDGWFKTGDLFYRDENNYYYFVERTGMLIKCDGELIPQEVEEQILSHKGVLEACVIGVPDPYDGQHPVACIVRNPGCEVTAQEIKDLVAEKYSYRKRLRGGIVFLDKLPMTHTGKVALSTLKEIVLQAHRE